MAVPSVITDLNVTAASNSPAGGEAIGTSLDDYLRGIQAIIRREQAQGAAIPSASTVNIGSTTDGSYVHITGTTTITSFGTVAAGISRTVVFDGALTLTHNTTSLILPGASNITTAAGDVAMFVSEGSGNWRCVRYMKADGTSFAVSGPNGSQFSFRNKFINGDMRIDQRNAGAAQTITAGAALAYTVDRWYGYCTGANVTGQRVAGTAPNQYNYRYTGAASVTKIGHVQRIEAANSQDLAGTTATLAVDLSNSLLTTVTWTAWYANSADTFGSLASPTRTQIATGTFTVSSTLTRYNTQISIPAAATTGVEVEFSVGAQTSGTWTIGRASLTPGSSATEPFEARPIGTELALCQRYLPSTGLPGTGITIGDGQAYSTTQGQAFIPFQVTPRVNPTGVSVSNATHFGVLNSGGGGVACTALAHQSAGFNGGNLTWTVSAGMTGGNGTMLSTSNASAQILWTGCEL